MSMQKRHAELKMKVGFGPLIGRARIGMQEGAHLIYQLQKADLDVSERSGRTVPNVDVLTNYVSRMVARSHPRKTSLSHANVKQLKVYQIFSYIFPSLSNNYSFCKLPDHCKMKLAIGFPWHRVKSFGLE